MHVSQAPRALPQGATVEEMDEDEHHGGAGRHRHHVQEPDDNGNGGGSGGGAGACSQLRCQHVAWHGMLRVP